jgi:hypothetical protein
LYELDHLLWAAPDLAEGERAFARITGVVPAGGGSHPGFGTRNNLASLGSGVYFEIISPDPAQPEFGRRAERIARLPAPSMHTFAVRGNDLEGFRRAASELGLKSSEPISMSRRRSDGVMLKWRVTYIEDEGWGDLIPFLIDWQDSEHPSKTAPGGCALREFRVLHPDAAALAEIYRRLGIPVAVARAPAAGYLVRLDTPEGEAVFI